MRYALETQVSPPQPFSGMWHNSRRVCFHRFALCLTILILTISCSLCRSVKLRGVADVRGEDPGKKTVSANVQARKKLSALSGVPKGKAPETADRNVDRKSQGSRTSLKSKPDSGSASPPEKHENLPHLMRTKRRRRGGAAGRRQKIRLQAEQDGTGKNCPTQRGAAGNQTTEQSVIQTFHVLNKKKRRAENLGDKEEAQKLSQSIEDSGGLTRYQAASLRGRNGTTADAKHKISGGKDVKSRSEKRRQEELGMEVGSSVFSSAVWVTQELEHRGFFTEKACVRPKTEGGGDANSTRKSTDAMGVEGTHGGGLKLRKRDGEAAEEKKRKTKKGESGEEEGAEQTRKEGEKEAARMGEKTVRLLDVGSIVNAYKGRISRIAAVCIDPAPKDPTVLKFDLLRYFEVWKKKKSKQFECVVLAMVLNFEPDHFRRGEMLAAAATMLVKGGLLLLSLPKACLTNSRYLDAVGLRVLRIKMTSKLALCSFAKRSNAVTTPHSGIPAASTSSPTKTPGAASRAASNATSPSEQRAEREANARVIRTGKGRNNFRIALPTTA